MAVCSRPRGQGSKPPMSISARSLTQIHPTCPRCSPGTVDKDSEAESKVSGKGSAARGGASHGLGVTVGLIQICIL